MTAPRTLVGENEIIASLRAEIARLTAERDAALTAERAATIEAAAKAADNAGMSLQPASGWDERDVSWWETGGLDHILAATDAIHALHTDATRAALELQPITVQDAARVPEIAALIKAAQSLNDDGDCHNAAEWFEGRLKKLNSALLAIAEGKA